MPGVPETLRLSRSSCCPLSSMLGWTRPTEENEWRTEKALLHPASRRPSWLAESFWWGAGGSSEEGARREEARVQASGCSPRQLPLPPSTVPDPSYGVSPQIRSSGSAMPRLRSWKARPGVPWWGTLSPASFPGRTWESCMVLGPSPLSPNTSVSGGRDGGEGERV